MKNNKGFSLVELIVVIAIMAILAAVAIPTFAHFITKANEASDAELLNNINYTLNLACVENGVDLRDVTAATWDKTNKCVTDVKVNGVDNDDIEASFVTHFDLTEEEFILIEDIVFDTAKHEFVDAKEVVNKFTDIFNSIDNIDELAALISGSTFGDIGAEGLLNRLDDVTGLAAELLGTNAGQGLKDVLSADIEIIASSMGMTESELEAVILAQGDSDAQNAYMNKLLANYAVLQVANTTADKDSEALLTDLRTGMTATDIQNMIGSDDSEASKDGVAKAAMMYAMYTAYANQLPEGDTKNAALANLTDMDTFVNAINAETQEGTDFMNYLNDDQAVTDMNGFVASMNVISNSTQGNTEATRDLLENGYDNSDLAGAMQGLIQN